MIEYINIEIVVIILLLFYFHTNQLNAYDKLIGGFYEAPPDFCIESDIDTFCLYIDNDVDVHGTRACYILMKSDDNLIINEPTTIKLTRRWSLTVDPCKPIYYDVKFLELSDEIKEYFPYDQQLRFYPNIGKVVLYSEDTIFGVFYKNGLNSELKTDDET